MSLRHGLIAVLVSTISLWLGPSARAQGDTFKARLTPVPVDPATVGSITGSGSVTAVLTGSTVSIKGTFDGMRTPATVARLHHGLKGIRGPAIFDLTVANGVSGTVSGTLKLTREQIDALRSEKLYVQIHSEKAPDGNLRGWLLK